MVSGYNVVMQARSPWLGQVRLVQRPALGHFEGDHTVSDGLTTWGTKDQPQSFPPQSVFPGREKCTFLGFWSEEHEFARTPELETKVSRASASGFEIKRLPASWPRSPFYPPGSIVPADMINGLEVWACPKELPVVVQSPPVKPGGIPVDNIPPQETPPVAPPVKASEPYNATTALTVGGIAAAGAVAAYFGMK